MRIDAITLNPTLLQNEIEKAIKEGKLRTWKIVYNDKKEVLYTHTPEQWNEKAMIKPYYQEGKLRLQISWWTKNGDPGKEINGYITGRFTEVLLVHFSTYYTQLETFPNK